MGSLLILCGLFLCLIIVGMFQNPGGMGIERLIGPLIGLLALGLFLAGGVCFYAASKIGKKTAGPGA
jgi:hypothetical protein